jgi:glycosyltransferase involved in cell wall biosynthesis
MPIQNAAGFSITNQTRKRQIAKRAQPRGARKLRVLYIGRLDPQKGVERLVFAAEEFKVRELPIELRVIGAGLLDSGGKWQSALEKVDTKIQKPVYASEDLIEAFSWADVLLLPSRWEGAPLVIAECHLLGCIPVATRVGAVEELTTHDMDGLLVESGDDWATAQAMVDRVESLIWDDLKRRQMAEAGMRRAELNTWDKNFVSLGKWIESAFKNRH